MMYDFIVTVWEKSLGDSPFGREASDEDIYITIDHNDEWGAFRAVSRYFDGEFEDEPLGDEYLWPSKDGELAIRVEGRVSSLYGGEPINDYEPVLF